MRLVARARILALLLAFAALVLAGYGLWSVTIGLLVLAASTALLVGEGSVPVHLVEAGAEGSVKALARAAAEMALEGNGIVLPGDAETGSHVFIPARKGVDISLGSIDSLNVLQRHREGAIGLLIPAPGAGFERDWEQMRGLPDGGGVEVATAALREAFPAFGLGRRLRVTLAAGRVRVTYEPIAFEDLCRDSADSLAPWHLQGGCPACSFAGAIMARCMGSPMRVLAAGREGPMAFVEWEVYPRSTP